MLIQCEIYKHFIIIDNKKVATYGIGILENNNILKKFDDVSLKYESVHSLACKLNNSDLNPIHFDDILQDFFEDYC